MGLKNQQSGMMLVSILIITTVLVLVGFSLASLSISQYSISNNKVFSANALMVAEAGVEEAMLQINQNESFTGHANEQIFFNNQNQGRGTYTTTISSSQDGNSKEVVSTGKVYRYNKNSAESSRIIKVTIVGTSAKGYSVHTGPGGLILGGSATITNSDVFVNGTLTLSGTSRIGTYSQPLNVDVAHNSCPSGSNPGPSYPETCTAGQPISMQQNTLIYGSVCATNQTSSGPRNGGNILPGNGGEGLKLGCKSDPVSPPTYNRSAHISAVNTTASGSDNSYICNRSPFTRNWSANIKLTGNVTIGSSCDITINGNTYITGNLSIGGASKLRVANSLGSNRPVVIVDGTITVNGSAQMIANDSATGIQFISFKSSASCSPACTSISGTDLKTSQSLETVTVNGGVNLPGMIFQAYWSKAVIGGSGSIGAVAGQTVDMSGAGTVTFGTELSSGVRTWTITSYQQDFPN